jgi:7,8-dihydro-6-hydroxymethylpterin-pyrophosphokinase
MQLLPAPADRAELGRGAQRAPTIDIDILLYGMAVVRTPKLEIPHPRIAERRFVLAPLADLAPDLRHPVTRLTIREMLAAAPPSTVRLLHS